MATETGYNANGRLTRYAFACGAIEHVGVYDGNTFASVSISMEHGAYIIRRHPAHATGWLVRSCRTLTEARRMAAAMARGETPERRDY